jgi:N6-adenosine-specific RNA methylase IME4
MLPDALRVMVAWGFTYKSAYGWMKPGRGHGYWSAKDQLELLLVGTRGKRWAPPVRGQQPPQVTLVDLLEEAPVATIRRGRHSAKPEAFYTEIEKMFPGTPKLEMLARRYDQAGTPGAMSWHWRTLARRNIVLPPEPFPNLGRALTRLCQHAIRR